MDDYGNCVETVAELRRELAVERATALRALAAEQAAEQAFLNEVERAEAAEAALAELRTLYADRDSDLAFEHAGRVAAEAARDEWRGKALNQKMRREEAEAALAACANCGAMDEIQEQAFHAMVEKEIRYAGRVALRLKADEAVALSMHLKFLRSELTQAEASSAAVPVAAIDRYISYDEGWELQSRPLSQIRSWLATLPEPQVVNA